MQVARIDIDRDEAARLYREYKSHRHYSTPVDDEIRKTYREIAKGNTVIRALESIRLAGLDAEGLPKLAIARADLPEVRLELHTNGMCRFASESEYGKWRKADNSARITLPTGTFPGAKYRHGPRATSGCAERALAR